MIRALVVGGKKQFVAAVIGPKLNRVGIEVYHHFEMRNVNVGGTIPSKVDLVILMLKVTSGPMISRVKTAAAKQGIRLVQTTRHWVNIVHDLARVGIVTQEQLTAEINRKSPATLVEEEEEDEAEEEVDEETTTKEQTMATDPKTPPAAPTNNGQLPVKTTMLPASINIVPQLEAANYSQLKEWLGQLCSVLINKHDVTLITVDKQNGVDIGKLEYTHIDLH